MKFLILRKRKFFKKEKDQKILLDDIQIEIAYIIRINKKIRKRTECFDGVFSLDFKEFYKESDMLKLFAAKGFEKILSRHGGTNKEVLEAQVECLSEENKNILITLALNVRYVIIHSELAPESFDFLCAEAGVCPEFAKGDYKESVVVHLGDRFFIKHLPTGMEYYDVLTELSGKGVYFLPEMNMIFGEYFRKNPDKMKNVKIRELMSK